MMMRFIAFPVQASAVHALDFDVRVPLPPGARLERFGRNPVVLWGHVPDDPIGTAGELAVREGVLTGRVRLGPERGERIVRKMHGGLIRYAELALDDDGTLVALSLVGPFSPGAELVDVPTPAHDASGLARVPALLFDSGPRKETTMSKSNVISAARDRVAERNRNQGLGPLAMTKEPRVVPFASSRPARHFDAGGNESAVVAELRRLVDFAAQGELSHEGAKRGAALLEVLADLYEKTPDPPRVVKERKALEMHKDARDASPVAAARLRVAARGLPPLAMTKTGGGDVA